MSRELTKTTSTVGGMTLISRILGLVRDQVIARLFGAGHVTDALFVALKLSNIFRRLFAEGGFAQGFIPVLSDYHHKQDKESMRFFIACMGGSLSFALVLFTVFGMLIAPLFVFIFAPGFVENGAQFALAAELLRITFPYLLFVSLTSFMGSVLNIHGIFWVPAFAPALLNVSMIVCAFVLSPFLEKPIAGVAWGVFLGGVLQFLFQLPHLKRLHLLPRLRLNWQQEGVQRVLKLMLPSLVGVSVSQINSLVDTLIGSFLQVGSISWLSYSDRIMEFPLGVFGIALSTSILPQLSKKHAQRDEQQFTHTIDWGVRCVLLIALPATLGLIFLSEPILATLFRYEKFSEHDVVMASKSLIAYASGLVAFILVKIFAAAYYARQDTKTPVKIAVATIILNIGLTLLLVYPLRLQYVGIALAMSLAAFANAFLLFRGLLLRKIYKPSQGTVAFFLRILLSVSAMVWVVTLFQVPLSTWVGWQGWQRGIRLGLIILSAIITYFGALWASGMRLHHFRNLSGSRPC